MPTFHIEAEVTLRGTIAVEADSLEAANARATDQDVTLIDEDFYPGAAIVDWEFGEATEL